MNPNVKTDEPRSWLDRPIIPSLSWLNLETLFFAAIVLLAIVSRFYDLGARVMSHDESLHTYYSWLLAKGQGYEHNPMMHGPLQFHLIALTYFLFGASDTTSRIPAALFNVATIWLIWYWRKYLGRTGALVAALLMLISPYMLYYARYTRNESLVGFFGVLMLYAMLRYLETGKNRYLYILTASVVLHFTSKETAYIYVVQALLFLAIYFIAQVTRRPWKDGSYYRSFTVALGLGILLVAAAIGIALVERGLGTVSATETAAPANPSATTSPLAAPQLTTISPVTITAILGLLVLLGALLLLIRGYSLEKLRQERSFNIIMLIVALVLPLGTPLLIKAAGWNPTDYSNEGMIHTAAFLIPIVILSVVIGWLWDFDIWWKAAALFWGIYVVFYSTIFTNGAGFFTGLIGSLGYWLDQQSVERGSQPWYFYLLIQIPIYEFLPALASILALFIGLKSRFEGFIPGIQPSSEDADPDSGFDGQRVVFNLLGFWTITSVVAFTLAGEKMPWLTFHIALPMILWGGWGIGQLIDRTDWEGLRQRKALLVVLVLAVFVMSIAGILVALLFSTTPPFQGKDLAQLETTSSFILAVVVALLTGWGLFRLLRGWELGHTLRLAGLAILGLLATLTIRATVLANYINYDNAEEYLVYAHGYTGVKDVMRQVDNISEHLTGGKNLVVAFDDDVSWPITWYLRDYPNQRYYGKDPTTDLRDAPVIIVGDNNFSKIEPVVGQAYYRFDYIRMIWPNQDYFNLTWDRVRQAIADPGIRAGIFDIWLTRDYTQYAQATGHNDLTLDNWEPSDRMRLYVKKDVAAQIWKYGVGPQQAQVDPYEKGTITLNADLVFGSAGQADGQFNAPRGIAVAPDGSLYVADSRNNRIQHFGADGQFIDAWGTFMDAAALTSAPAGTFNEPWGVAVGPDGSVYVTDTWNHRIQKFDGNGRPLKTWGHYGLADTPDGFWGPRGIAVDVQGRVYVADTGNKRIVIYDADGNFLGQFGGDGLEPGQFNEPVDVAVDNDGNLYVTDTWNQRVQTFAPSADGLTFTPLKQWDINGWFGESLDNKPFIAVDNQGHVFITDPEGYRVIEFTTAGKFIRTWGSFGTGSESFGLASGIKVDDEGHIWVSDAGNNRLMRFTLP
jgi:predicted membrane-bound mannosyltransferase/DNA-binding beta-propeller fold protein YncE